MKKIDVSAGLNKEGWRSMSDTESRAANPAAHSTARQLELRRMAILDGMSYSMRQSLRESRD